MSKFLKMLQENDRFVEFLRLDLEISDEKIAINTSGSADCENRGCRSSYRNK